MTCKMHFLLLSLLALPSLAAADDWTGSQGISYWCGGVGAESQAQMKAAESLADARLVLTAGTERAFLSDVKVTVTSADKQHSASWQAAGPICLLKLPQGAYSVETSYRDERHTASLNVKPARAGALEPLIFTFKPS